MSLCKLTETELAQLRQFAQIEGRNWKSVLQRESWWRGIPCRDRKGNEYPDLYGLRNSHGPSWLFNFRFPKEESE